MTEFDALCANDSELAPYGQTSASFSSPIAKSSAGEPAVDSWLARWDAGFSSRLGDAGFVGMTIPTEYGGRGLGHLHRYVVTEELLAQGAPVAAHWFSDRQFAPSLLSYGTDEQRRVILPIIAAGRMYAAIGMSEHGAGSDLAAVKTRANRVDGGWTSAAPRCGRAVRTWRIGSSCSPAPVHSIRITATRASASSS